MSVGYLTYNQLFSFLLIFPQAYLILCSIKIGLGQVQLKLGDLRSALTNFEKVLEVLPENCDTLKVSDGILL